MCIFYFSIILECFNSMLFFLTSILKLVVKWFNWKNNENDQLEKN